MQTSFSILSLILLGYCTVESRRKDCHYALRRNTALINSPQFPQPYPNGLNCSWQIVVPVGRQIVLNTRVFDLESSYNCESDALYIYDGPNEKSKLYSKPYCSRKGPENVKSAGNSLFIRFITDKLDNARGFSLEYKSVKVCDYEFKQVNGSFASPRYPDNYYENANCSYRIITDVNKAIELRFHDFALENKVNDDCLDYVKVYDVLSTETRLLRTLCGDALPLPIRSLSNQLLIKFHSDGLINNHGFNISFDSVAAVCGRNEFKCGNGQCVHVRLLCNSVSNCLDNTDEVFCSCSRFKCKNHRCISDSVVCDGINDCGDWSDEENCDAEGQATTTIPPQTTDTTEVTTTAVVVTTPAMNCRYSEYECDNKQCIAATERCDGRDDCGDNTDESDCYGQCKNMNGGCDHICTYDRRTGVKCRCNKGFQLDSDGTSCIDINECSSRPCAELCTNLYGSYKCGCSQGYRLASDQYNCTDFDECTLKMGQCEQRCINEIGTYKCACFEGFLYDKKQKRCIDIDECLIDNGGCEEKCVNEIGFFSCACNKTGYKMIPGKSQCEENNECELGTATCSQICVNTDGSYKCRCRPGFRLHYNEHDCVDVDECLEGVAGCWGECINTLGSYRCNCDPGFKEVENNTKCADVDECQIKNGGCSNLCINTQGSFMCKCHRGYIARDSRSFTCVDKNECLKNPCEEECINTPGSFQCRCSEGYRVANRTKCADMNECLNPAKSGCEYRCINTDGSFFCTCRDGQILNSDNRTCVQAVNGTGCPYLHINTSTIMEGKWTTADHGWAWQASLSIEFSTLIIPRFKCMGILVDSQFVLTTAHCVKISYISIEAEKILVSLGGNRYGDRYSEQNIRAKRIIFHGRLDLALIQLTSKVKVSKSVQPICLLKGSRGEDASINQKVVASTWTQDYLQHVYTTIDKSRHCEWNTVRIFRDVDSLCARFDLEKTFLPMSGSPLLAMVRGPSRSGTTPTQKWYLTAILIHGDGYPGRRKTFSPVYKYVGYFKASQFVHWVQDTIKRVGES